LAVSESCIFEWAIIDRHVHILPAGAARLAGALSDDAMTHLLEAPKLLDIEMERVLGGFMLITLRRRLDLQWTQAVERIALKDLADSYPAEPRIHGDTIHGPAPSAPGDDLSHDPLRCPARLTLWA